MQHTERATAEVISLSGVNRPDSTVTSHMADEGEPHMTIAKICCRNVDLAEPDEAVLAAAQRMHARKVGTLVVLDDKKRPIGLITDRDLTVRVLAVGLDPTTTDVSAVMTRNVRTVREDCSIEAALEIMRSGPFRRLCVVSDDDSLAGIISIDDILDLLAEEFRTIGRLLSAESQESLAFS